MICTTQRSGLTGEQEKRLMARFKSVLPRKESAFHSNKDRKAIEVLSKYLYDDKRDEVLLWLNYVEGIGFGYKYIPEQIKTAVETFQAAHVPDGSWRRTWREAKDLVSKVFNPYGKRFHVRIPRNLDELKSLIPHNDTYPGFSYYLTGKRKKGEYYRNQTDFLEWLRFGEALGMGSTVPPCDPCLRIQNGGLLDEATGEVTGEVKFKNRLVLADDINMVTWDAVFHRQLMNEAFQHAGSYSTGKTNGELHDLITRDRFKFAHCVNIDFSHYDQSISGWQMRECFNLIKEWLIFDSPEQEKIWQAVANSYISKDIVWGKSLVHLENGMVSGKLLTNYIDSMVQMWMLFAYFIHLGIESRLLSIHSCGDDGLVFTQFKVDLDDMASYLKYNFGIIMNPDKCVYINYGEAPWYLKRRWKSSGQWRDWRMVVAKLQHPEHYHDYNRNKDMDPALMVWAAILTYPSSMREIINVEEFKANHPISTEALLEAGLEHSPSGYFRYLARYVPQVFRDLEVS